VAPVIDDPRADLAPGTRPRSEGETHLDFQLPLLPPGGVLPTEPHDRAPRYQSLPSSSTTNVLVAPGIVQVTLPASHDEIGLWANIEPLEAGIGEFPPTLADTKLEDRLVTWLRVKAPSGAQARLLWVGINATTVSQRAHVANEPLPDGTGEPDQLVRLSHAPVIPSSLRLVVAPPAGEPEAWTLTDDLTAAPPEVAGPDLRLPPGSPAPSLGDPRVFVLDPSTGAIRFGDGARGKRPPARASIRATYDFGSGAAGNVAANQISAAPGIPSGLTVTNPLPTWGGADAGTVAEAEKQAARYLKHRDRLVSLEDFETIAWRTPGVDIGRIDAIAAYNPQLAPSQAGDAAGAVTLMLVPSHDAQHPAAPEPDQRFLDAVCDYLDPRRLVTTEVFLRGPDYQDVWVAVGIDIVAGESAGEVRERVRAELSRFLAPIDPTAPPWYEDPQSTGVASPYVHPQRGWPLGKAVRKLELAAVAARVQGVVMVNAVELALADADPADELPMSGLQLPRATVAVAVGTPPSLDELRGRRPPDAGPPSVVPVPLVPETC